MEIEHTKSASGGKFFSNDNGEEIAEMTYKNRDEIVMVIDHTFVNEKHRKEGLGGKLVKEAVDYARENNKKIIPQCPFAREVFKENSSYSDVLK
ncbi:hypothetical protein SAMN03097699_1158 [Flavobacteriaceae bacterium MAR_2010_188]|nr:hypothetical protein SAMN03097699_1158 [Flavobacteriaceae bacterium MAR_2010_188]